MKNALSDEGSRFGASHPTPQGKNQVKTREAPALGRQGFGRRDLAEWGLGGLFKVRKKASCFPWSDRAVFVLTCTESVRNPIELSFCTGLRGPRVSWYLMLAQTDQGWGGRAEGFPGKLIPPSRLLE